MKHSEPLFDWREVALDQTNTIDRLQDTLAMEKAMHRVYEQQIAQLRATVRQLEDRLKANKIDPYGDVGWGN